MKHTQILIKTVGMPMVTSLEEKVTNQLWTHLQIVSTKISTLGCVKMSKK